VLGWYCCGSNALATRDPVSNGPDRIDPYRRGRFSVIARDRLARGRQVPAGTTGHRRTACVEKLLEEGSCKPSRT